MAYPDTTESRPTASTTLSGNDGNLAHSAYDGAVWQALKRIGDSLVGARGSFETIALRLASIDGKLTRIRTVNGDKDNVAVGSQDDVNTGFIFPANGEIDIISNTSTVASISSTVVEIAKTFVVSAGSVSSSTAQVFFPGVQQSAAGSTAYLRWHATAGELIAATSSIVNKTNLRPIDGLRLLRKLEPTRYDLNENDPVIKAGVARRVGFTDDIPGFIAENASEVDPSLAASGDDGKPTGVDVEAILAVVAAAVKQNDARITALEGDA